MDGAARCAQTKMAALQHILFVHANFDVNAAAMLGEMLRQVFADFIAISQLAQRNGQALACIAVQRNEGWRDLDLVFI